MNAAHIIALATVALIEFAQPAGAGTQRTTCDGFEGTRILYSENPVAAHAEGYLKEVIGRDKITGLVITLIYEDGGDSASVTLSGNVNSNKNVHLYDSLHIITKNGHIFMWRDEADGTNILSYYPNLNRALYSIHGDRLGPVDMTLIGKIFYAVCRSEQLK